MTKILSSSTAISVRGAGSSALASLAATMAPGSWANFACGNLSNATLYAYTPGGTLGILNNFGNRLVWDAAHRKIQYAASAHTGGAVVAGAGGLATWDDTTNQWSRETYNWSSENPGHSYHHVAVNPGNGDLYFRSFNSRSIYRRVYGQTGQAAWQIFSTISYSNWANQVAGALEWLPGLNGGAGGLVFADALGAAWSNAALTSWTGQSGSAPSGNYHNWSAGAGGLVYFGGGNGSTAMYAINSSGAVSSKAATPMQAGANAASAVFAHPNGTDLLLFQNYASTGAIYRFNGTSWSSAGTHQIGDSSGVWAGCAIPEYGVMLFLVFPNASGTPFCKIYKP
jgi:hypothetical protein